jgi:hypothetical protein
MAENLLQDEFGGSSMELFHLGVVAFDERALSDAVLARANTKALTGISTAASIEVCDALLARTRTDVQRLETLSTRNVETNTRLDDLRIKEQLLVRLVNSKRPAVATGASASNSSSSSSVKRSAALASSHSQGATPSSQQKSPLPHDLTASSGGDRMKKTSRGLTVKFAESPLAAQPSSSSSSSTSTAPPKITSLTPLQLVAEALAKNSSSSLSS